MRRFIRCFLILLRVLPQEKYTETEPKTLSKTAKQSSKIYHDTFEEDQQKEVTPNIIKDTAAVEIFTYYDEKEDEEEQGETQDISFGSAKYKSFHMDASLVPRGDSELIEMTNKFDYRLRGLGLFGEQLEQEQEIEVDEEGFESVISTCLMKSKLFEGELFDIVKDENLIQRLHKIIFYEELHGPKPKLPFSLDSFLQYLFVESRDLKLIRVGLRVCQSFPLILVKYDQNLRARGFGIRENLLLQFLVKIQDLDMTASKTTIQLMGFKNIVQLMMYYKDHVEDDAMIADAMIKLGYGNNEAVNDEKQIKHYEYIYEHDMID